ncbi:hypothetical protein [Melittangium boletus]|uniref:hypothetical protein n=1 Tax=Melittangium boletus TaxID=83453 RepID=UPI000BB2CF5F|nr:hypothetical protein [Melittangium boletus]
MDSRSFEPHNNSARIHDAAHSDINLRACRMARDCSVRAMAVPGESGAALAVRPVWADLRRALGDARGRGTRRS